MPTASTESLLASALTKVKHRNSELVKRDVLTTLHHYRGKIYYWEQFQLKSTLSPWDYLSWYNLPLLVPLLYL